MSGQRAMVRRALAKVTADKGNSYQYRFGIAEWYGRSFVHLSSQERRFYSSIQLLPKDQKPAQPCPFLSKPDKVVNCWKPSGICSLRSYQRSLATGEVAMDARGSTVRTTCPSRFEEANTVYRWIGETILGDEKAVAVGETPFLERSHWCNPVMFKFYARSDGSTTCS